MGLIKFEDVNSKIIKIREENVILDSAVAELYGVETKRINEALKNNRDKFPEGYVLALSKSEKQEVVEIFDHLRRKLSNEKKQEVVKNFDHLEKLKFSPTLPKAFTEKGLYMLATILKSPRATQTTIAIIEAFTQMRAMSNAIAELMKDNENEAKQQYAIQKSEEVFGTIINSAMDTVGVETSFELNLAALKIKHTVTRKKRE